MLQNTFLFLDGIRHGREKALWNQGIKDWNDFLSKDLKGISSAKKERHDAQIMGAKKAMADFNSSYFSQKLPKSETWRLFKDFKDEACFLDIETSGYYSDVTVIGVSDGFETKTFVKGINLNRNKVIEEIEKYKLVLTFNGGSFDLPVIKKYFGYHPGIPHIDLRHVCSKIGLNGGLKSIEQQLGIKRDAEVKTVTGSDAVIFWELWKRTREKKYLELLVQYNREDCENLRPLSNFAIAELWKRTFNFSPIIH